uniref:Chloroplast envelope protein 1 n=1 Tax=Solanum tuberosum TaxID=4113 RepID=M1B9P4_SOLTU
MGSSSTFSLCSHPTVNFEFNGRKVGYGLQKSLSSSSSYCLIHISPICISSRRKCLQLRRVIVRAASSSSTGPRRSTNTRRVYKESQAQTPALPVDRIVSFVVPAGAFVVISFVLWKLVEKVLLPKPAKTTSEESKSTQGLKWSIAAGTNLLPGFGAKIERESKLRLNDFAKELRSFSIVDMSGRNFGDEGLFFLAESLAYNQTAEEVNFAANGITADGLKAFDGILQSNIALKTLNLSGNAIGDEGAKCLCDILANNSGIQKLQLNSTGLGDEGAKAIGEMLKKNSTLRVLELNNNLIDYSVCY